MNTIFTNAKSRIYNSRFTKQASGEFLIFMSTRFEAVIKFCPVNPKLSERSSSLTVILRITDIKFPSLVATQHSTLWPVVACLMPKRRCCILGIWTAPGFPTKSQPHPSQLFFPPSRFHFTSSHPIIRTRKIFIFMFPILFFKNSYLFSRSFMFDLPTWTLKFTILTSLILQMFHQILIFSFK
jgi:hypothetical protein